MMAKRAGEGDVIDLLDACCIRCKIITSYLWSKYKQIDFWDWNGICKYQYDDIWCPFKLIQKLGSTTKT